MNYHKITSPDMLNGSGLRTVLWVSGCTHGCRGCHNPETHSFNSGIKFTTESMNELMEKSSPDYIKGLTLTGGDPLMPENIYMVKKIITKFKSIYPGKDIWVYTGYAFEVLRDDAKWKDILSKIDVLVDGRFYKDLSSKLLHFRGSSNQRLIDVKSSLSSNSIVTLDI